MIILPDIHGRTFWKNAVKGHENDIIVFLGDYLDPYGHEGISVEDAIVNFEDIIQFKKDHNKNVILLLGNHDCGYIWPSVNSCRRSDKYYNDINAMFRYNFDLFELAYQTEINGKKYLLSHAGIHKEWADLLLGIYKPEYLASTLNNWLHTADDDVIAEYLGIYSAYRGYTNNWHGSCVWADVREWGTKERDNQLDDWGIYQIFGHTQLESKPIIHETFACLDLRCGFTLDESNEIKQIEE